MFISLLPFVAGAVDGRYANPSTIRYYQDFSLWLRSTNAAGLASTFLPEYNIVSALYSTHNGDFHRVQSGDSFSDIAFDTEGSLGVGKTRLWGHFRYDNITEKGTAYNTILFDPYDERQIFSVADPRVSDWKRQAYLMEFKTAHPISDRLFAGVHVSYADRLAAKQVDPRSESFRYDLSVIPSVAWRIIGLSSIGLSLEYSRFFERTAPTLSNASEIQDVYVLRGLGNFVKDIVGSGGLSTIYYDCNTWGASAQYNLYKCEWELLAEAGFRSHATSTRESATQPFNMGSTRMQEAFTNISAKLPSALLAASFIYRNTDATEYTSVWNLSTGEWEVRTSALGSRYGTVQAGMSYDHYFGDRDDALYDWLLGARVGWISKNDRYLLPAASFTYSNLCFSARTEKLFSFGKLLWEAGADVLYNLNLGGEYSYTGVQPNENPATIWYPGDISVLGSDYFSAGASVGVTKKSLSISAKGNAIFASEGRKRFCLSLGLNLIF